MDAHITISPTSLKARKRVKASFCCLHRQAIRPTISPLVDLKFCFATISFNGTDKFLNRIKLDAKDVLEMFFCYSKKVVEATRETCYEQLKYYEEQVDSRSM